MIATTLLTIALLQGGAPSTGSGQRAAGQSAADGVWQARYTNTEGRNHEFTLTITTTDGVISGTVSSTRGSVPITKGNVSGRDVAFTVTRRANYDEIDVTFTGTIDSDAMKLKMQVAGREAVSITARREAAGTPAADRVAADRVASAFRRK
jgi:hypothetical protein